MPAWWAAALSCRCPRCGQGQLFQGLLTVCARCETCDLDLAQHDAGDGAAFAAIFVLCPLIVALAFWLEFRFSPPLWVRILLWPLLTVPLTILLMRPMKAALVALQYRHRATEMGL